VHEVMERTPGEQAIPIGTMHLDRPTGAAFPHL